MKYIFVILIIFIAGCNQILPLNTAVIPVTGSVDITQTIAILNEKCAEKQISFDVIVDGDAQLSRKVVKYCCRDSVVIVTIVSDRVVDLKTNEGETCK